MSEVENKPKEKRYPLLGGGPLGLGDPDDVRLRKAEKDVIIPRWLKEEATKRCSDSLKVFSECAKREGLMVVFSCKKERDFHNDCLVKWLKNPEFVQEITDKYLRARSHYRRTGEPLEKYERKKGRSGFC